MRKHAALRRWRFASRQRRAIRTTLAAKAAGRIRGLGLLRRPQVRLE
jgi:hypothetical protein